MKNRTFESFLFEWCKKQEYWTYSGDDYLNTQVCKRHRYFRCTQSRYNKQKYRLIRELFWVKNPNKLMFNIRNRHTIIRCAVGYIKTGIIKEL